jgi:hypothetical protein
MSGQWAQVLRPDGSVRHDWVPAEQPPSPDGAPGLWHVVEDQPGEPTRWEWHPSPEPAPTPQPHEPEHVGPAAAPIDIAAAPARQRPGAAARKATDDAPDDRRAALAIGAIWGAFVALLPGIREPLVATWNKVSDDGSAGHTLLLALLVAIYVLAAAGVAWAFAKAFERPPGPRRRAPSAS